MKRQLLFTLFICVFVIMSLFSIDLNAGAQTGTGEQEAETSVDIKKRVEQLRKEEEIKDDQAAHALKLHLTAVEQFEKKDEEKKVIKHMKGFLSLLAHQRENEQMSEAAYEELKADADELIERWDSLQIVKDGKANAVVVAPELSSNQEIDKDTVPGWSSWIRDEAEGYSTLDFDTVRGGDASLAVNIKHGNLFQKMAVEPGPFELKVYYYTATKGDAKIRLEGRLKDDNNENIKVISNEKVPTSDTAGEWHAITLKGDIPEEVDGKKVTDFQAIIYVLEQDDVPVYIDDTHFIQENKENNLLENPGFEEFVYEDPETQEDIPAWGSWIRDEAEGYSTLDFDTVRSGNASLAVNIKHGNLFQKMAVEPGPFEFIVYYYTPTKGDAEIRLEGRLKDANSDNIKVISGEKVLTSDTAGEWHAVTLSGDIPEEVDGKEVKDFQAIIYVLEQDDVPVYIDDTHFYQDDENDNLLKNPGFEELDDWKSAQTLVEYVQKATGVELPIVSESKLEDSAEQYEGQTRIYIDEAAPGYEQLVEDDFTDFDDHGFVIYPAENDITIAGPTKVGTRNGVYDFLERYLDIRWLLQDPTWEDIPQLSDVRVTRKEIRNEPVFSFRYLSDENDAVGKNWTEQNKLQLRQEIPVEFMHNLYNLFPVEKFGETHPEFYPDDNPSTDGKMSWQPCFTADGNAEAAALEIIDYFDKRPDETSYSLGINDTRNFCEADPDHPDYPDKRNSVGDLDMSEIFYTWVNDVVEQVREVHPDKYFGLLAYNNVMDPPSFELDSHVVPFITKDRMTWIDDDKRVESEQRVEDWKEVADQIAMYDYMYGTFYTAPRVYPHTMDDVFKYASENDVIGFYTEMYPNVGDGPKAWLYAKLLWDPDQDVDDLLNEWYERAVGKEAAPDLKAYYDLWEDFWTERIKDSSWFEGSKSKTYLRFTDASYLRLVTEDDLKESKELLDVVIEKTESEQQQERAEQIRRMFEYYEASALSYPKDDEVDTPTNEADAIELLDDIKQSLEMGERRLDLIEEFEDTRALTFPPKFHNKSSMESWSGVQRLAFNALEDYVALESADGRVGQLVEEFLDGLSETIRMEFTGSTNAIKTTASKEDILQSFDFSQGPWEEAEEITYFRIMGEPDQKPSVDTKVKLLWDDDNLYVGYENFDPELPPETEKDGWEGNSDQTILAKKPEESMTGYFTDPEANKYFFRQVPGSRPEEEANNEWETATQIGEDSWNTVQVIPFSSLDVDASQTDEIWALFFRYYNDEAEYIGWGAGQPWNLNHLRPVHLVDTK